MLEVPDGFPSPQDILQYRYPRLRPAQGLYLLQYSTAHPGSDLTPIKLTNYADVNHTVHKELVSHLDKLHSKK